MSQTLISQTVGELECLPYSRGLTPRVNGRRKRCLLAENVSSQTEVLEVDLEVDVNEIVHSGLLDKILPQALSKNRRSS